MFAAMSPTWTMESNKRPNIKLESPEENGPRIFVGGLNFDTTDDSLEAYFSSYGTLTEARVTKNEGNSTSKGYGFITFSNEAEVDACQEARPHFIDGYNVSTFRYVPKEQDKRDMTHMDAPRGHCKKLYISSLSQSVQKQDLEDYFGKYGNILNIELKSGNGGGKGNFAFVEFDDYDPVDKCIIAGTHRIGGLPVVVRRALSNAAKDTERKIIIGPLNDLLTDETLYKYFSEFGKMKRIERPIDKTTRKRRDFAFIEFDDMITIEKIVAQKEHQIQGHEIRVKKVTQKDWSRDSVKGMRNQNVMWNNVNINPLGMYNPYAMGMNGFSQGFGAYQGFPIQNQAYINQGMPFAETGRPMKNAKFQERFNPYNVSKEIDLPESYLMRYFSNFGNVVNVERPWDGKNKRKRDYAFVEFEDPNSVRMCMLYTGHQIMGHNLVVRRGSTKGETPLNMERKIFVDLKGKSKGI